MLELLANLATIVAAVGALLVYGDARRKTIHHLRAHIALAKIWARGHSGYGWVETDVTPTDVLQWRHPRNDQIQIFSAPALSQVTLLQNVFIPESLTPLLIRASQTIEAFNAFLDQYVAFKVSDHQMMVNVERKLDAGIAAVFPSPGIIAPRPPDNMSQAQLIQVLGAANLTTEENAWSEVLLHMLLTAHLIYIGDAHGRGVFRRLEDLESEFFKHFG